MKPTSPITTKNKLESQELFKISRFKPLIKKTKPHKHEGYFEMIFIAEGEGFHWIETENFQIQTPDFSLLSFSKNTPAKPLISLGGGILGKKDSLVIISLYLL